MKKYFLIFTIWIMTTSFAVSAELRLHFNVPEVQQGAITDAVIEMGPESVQGLELQSLKGRQLGKILYFQSISPLVKRDNTFVVDAKVIFLKVPVQNQISEEGHTITWEIKVLPTEGTKGFLFENFDVPRRMRLFYWIVVPLLGALLAFGAYIMRKKWLIKKEKRNSLLKIKDEILGASSYEDVVNLWKKKHEYVKMFPHLEVPFKDLETVLFKVQFRPTQTEMEKKEVLKAYGNFRSQVEGGFNGI